VKIPSKTNREFWLFYHKLPPEIRAVARKNYQLWKENALHPSLHFKSIKSPRWSVRIGQNYRAVGKFVGSTFYWEWIGTHDEYDKRF
jgi:hypothetical protein